jgi:AraC family transcriptional regulator, transcriptional activator of pobA
MTSEALPVQLYPIDYRTDERAFISQPHRHTVAEIFFFVQGNGTHYIDFAAYPIGAASVFLVAPRQVHYIEAPAHSYNRGYVICFDSVLLDLLPAPQSALFGSFTQPPAYQLPPATAEFVGVALSQLADELTANQPRTVPIARLLIELLLTYVERQAAVYQPDSRAGGAKTTFARLVAVIEADYCQPHTVQHYADLLHLTARQLNRLCRQVRQQPALAVIHERLLLEAKRRLFYAHEPIKEIAYRLGFGEPAHFTHFFRRLTGLTPEMFRAQMAQIRK